VTEGGAGAVDALIPLKRLDRAKSRLADVLDPTQRVRLMQALVERTVREAQASQAVGRIWLVTSDPKGRAIASDLGIGLVDDQGLPWNDALASAISEVVSAEAVLILSADLPLVAADEIDDFVRRLDSNGLGIARAVDAGTNAVVMRPAGSVRTCFGDEGSAAKHAQLAGAAGLPAVIADIPGLALDLDSPEDLEEATRRGLPAAISAALSP
jgi:2-phospho-L-lactate guanylyltransferase